jgi:hypothetical protein
MEVTSQEIKQLRRPAVSGRTYKFAHGLTVDSQTTIDGRQFALAIVRDGMHDIFAKHLQFFRHKLGRFDNAHKHTPCPNGTVD